MADHDVTLKYAPNGFQATPQSIRVRPGQTISFKLADNSIGGKFRIKFADRQFFATPKAHFAQDGVLHQGDGEVRVANALSGRTTYHCELLDDQGHVIAQSSENQGGDILLDS